MKEIDHRLWYPSMDFGGRLSPREIVREESPERFIALFKEITGMKTLQELNEIGDGTIESMYTGVIGSVILGSSSDPVSTPKDLDVALVLGRVPNHYTYDYIEELRMKFDQIFSFRHKIDMSAEPVYPLPIEHGRLDVLGSMGLQERMNPMIEEAVRRSPSPITLAYTLNEATQIDDIIQSIRENRS